MTASSSAVASRVRTLDANEAVANMAYRASEVIAIYPITPASPMGEHADAWAADGRTHLWGAVPQVVEMQSEGGAAGAVHGALQAGQRTVSQLGFWLTTSFGAIETGFVAASIATWYYASDLGAVLGWTIGVTLTTAMVIAGLMRWRLKP